MTNKDLEFLRTFALAHREVAFAHLCTAALSGEEWAVKRVQWSLNVKAGRGHDDDEAMLDVIRATDTVRPDGAVARQIEI